MTRRFFACIVLWMMIFSSCRHDSESFLKKLKPDLDKTDYNDLLKEYAKAKVFRKEKRVSKDGTPYRYEYFNFKQYQFSILDDHPNDDYKGMLYFIIDANDQSQYTIQKFKQLVNDLEPVYGRPTESSFTDTTKYGYNYVAWRNHERYSAKLEFIRDTTYKRFLLFVRPTLKLIASMFDEEEREQRASSMGAVSFYNFSDDIEVQSHLMSIVTAHNLDSAKNYAIEDFKKGRYYVFWHELMTDGVYVDFKKQLKTRYGITVINLGDINFDGGSRVYMQTMMPLLIAKGIPSIYAIERDIRKKRLKN